MAHRQVVVAGAHVLCYINGRLIGRVSTFSMQSMTSYSSRRGLDIPYVLEKVPTTTDINFQLGLIRTIGDGGAQGAGLAAQQPDISRMKYFTILLKDRRTDLALFEADLCVCNSEQWNIDAKGRMVGSVSCEGITWTNEAGSL